MLKWALQQSPNPVVVLKEGIDMHLLKKNCKPEEIAELIVFLCSNSEANITGQSCKSDGAVDPKGRIFGGTMEWTRQKIRGNCID